MRAGSTVRLDVDAGSATTTAILERAEAPLGHLLVLGHGAGGRAEHRTMIALAGEMRSRGIDTVRFDFPYRARGSGPPDRMPVLAACFARVAERCAAEAEPVRLLLGGHSMGGRAASVLASQGFACDGLVLLAYPLHPAGKPESLRDEHLARIERPVLCLNGTRDELCRKDLMDAVVARLTGTFEMQWLEHADHGFHVLKRSGRTDAEVLDEIGAATLAWTSRTFGSR